MLQNIIENAIKYGDGRKIVLRVSDEEDCKLISVTNTGTPLPDSEQIHIFDSFYRGSNSERVSGSGLGLFICRQLMQKMGGDIFASQNESEFSVTCVFRLCD